MVGLVALGLSFRKRYFNGEVPPARFCRRIAKKIGSDVWPHPLPSRFLGLRGFGASLPYRSEAQRAAWVILCEVNANEQPNRGGD